MKTITVDRNFRISNDDPYLKERLFLTREVPDEVDEDKIITVLRDKLNANFKAAYPHVYTYLNFEEVRQADKPNQSKWEMPKYETIKPFDLRSATVTELQPEKTNKGTIEEQIEASKDLDELDGWKLIAKSNTKLQEVFSQREKELINEAVK